MHSHFSPLYIGALTCTQWLTRKVCGLPWRKAMTFAERVWVCVRDQERSPIAVRACVNAVRKITKSPFSCVSSSVTSRKVRSVATPMRRQQVVFIRPASTGCYRSHQGGEAWFSISVVEDYKAPTIGCAADSPRASRNDDVVREKRPKTRFTTNYRRIGISSTRSCSRDRDRKSTPEYLYISNAPSILFHFFLTSYDLCTKWISILWIINSSLCTTTSVRDFLHYSSLEKNRQVNKCLFFF